MFIPISTDTSFRRVPWVNYGLITANVLIHLLPMLVGSGSRAPSALAQTVNGWLELGVLDGSAPRLYQFITYQFLHAPGFAHLGGNMLFLWVFGNAVNAKMGQWCYLLFYLAGGVFAATGHGWYYNHSLVGASGSIAAVTTAYLALFPRSQITVLYWWFFIGTFQLPSMWMIGAKLILWDNMLAPGMIGESNVAYNAHLAGYAFGLAATAGLLAVHILPRDQYDIVALWRRGLQRRQMRSAMSDPTAEARARYGRVARPVSMDRLAESGEPAVVSDPVSGLRSRIAEALVRQDRDSAAELYERLIDMDPAHVLPRPQQLDVANQLYTLHRIPQAAAAYERYLRHYSGSAEADHVRLLLGIIYARDLEQHEVAEGHLLAVLGRLNDDKRRQQCLHWLQVASVALGRPLPNNAAESDSSQGQEPT